MQQPDKLTVVIAHRDPFLSAGLAHHLGNLAEFEPVGEMQAVAKTGSTGPREWVHQVITLLDAAVSQLDHEQAVYGTILKAASLLRKQIDPEVAGAAPDIRGGLLAWQARKVRAYIDSHITGPVLVAELCALVPLSEAHFSRVFKRTFGKSPHAFVIRRRVELAAQYMLQTEAPLSDIALRCGFTDQPHLCKHFRQATGHTPAAWRRESYQWRYHHHVPRPERELRREAHRGGRRVHQVW
jgi:AraC family transcriptional regulator